MAYVKWAISLLVSLTFGLMLTVADVAIAADPAVLVKVGLNPVGSFEMKSDHVEGMGKKTGDQYSAKTIKVAVQSLNTGMSLRDTHMKEKLEGTKYKYIMVSDIKASGGSGTAKITIRNVTKDISFDYKDLGTSRAEATFKLNLKDFEFTGINYKGVGVEDEVEVTARVPYQ